MAFCMLTSIAVLVQRLAVDDKKRFVLRLLAALQSNLESNT